MHVFKLFCVIWHLEKIMLAIWTQTMQCSTIRDGVAFPIIGPLRYTLYFSTRKSYYEEFGVVVIDVSLCLYSGESGLFTAHG